MFINDLFNKKQSIKEDSGDAWHVGGQNSWSTGPDDGEWSSGATPGGEWTSESDEVVDTIPALTGVDENAEELHTGDPVIITGPVKFKGATGEIVDFGKDKRFVVVNLYNHGKHSFHSSDVSFNDYADSDAEEADMYNRDSDVRNWAHDQEVAEHISKVKGGYELKSKKTGKNLGKYPTKAGAEKREREVEYFKHKNEGVAEGYILKKTNVNKYVKPGDPDEYTDEIKAKDTDYEIINNKTGQVVGVASWYTNDYFGPGALKITMKNGATRFLDITAREKGNPQSAFNRFVKDLKTSKKYKKEGVAENWPDYDDNQYSLTDSTGKELTLLRGNTPEEAIERAKDLIGSNEKLLATFGLVKLTPKPYYVVHGGKRQSVKGETLNEVTQGVEHSEWVDNVKDHYHPTPVKIIKKRTDDGRHIASHAMVSGKKVGQYNMNTGVGTFTTRKKQGVSEGFGDISNPMHPMNPLSPTNPINIARATGALGKDQQTYQEISNIALGLGTVLGVGGAALIHSFKNLFKHPESATLDEVKQVQRQIAELYKKTQTLKSEQGRAKAQEELKAAYEVLEELKAKVASGVKEQGVAEGEVHQFSIPDKNAEGNYEHLNYRKSPTDKFRLIDHTFNKVILTSNNLKEIKREAVEWAEYDDIKVSVFNQQTGRRIFTVDGYAGAMKYTVDEGLSEDYGTGIEGGPTGTTSPVGGGGNVANEASQHSSPYIKSAVETTADGRTKKVFRVFSWDDRHVATFDNKEAAESYRRQHYYRLSDLDEAKGHDPEEDNFTADDIKNLERIHDLPTLKARAKELIKGKPVRRMKPEKISYFYHKIDELNSPFKVIKLMYDLLLAGEGMRVLGTRHSMNPNAYQTKFGESREQNYWDQLQEERNEKIDMLIKELEESINEGKETWQKQKNPRAGGMSKKAVKSYRRSHPGSKIKTAVTKKPSKIKKGSSDDKRRKSFCARMRGMKKHNTSAKTKNDPNSAINKSLRRWHCESVEELKQMLENAQQWYANHLAEEKKKITAKNDPCWTGYHMVGKKKKNGREVPNCVPGKKGD